MKRLRFFAIISILLFGIVGNFSVPNLVSAGNFDTATKNLLTAFDSSHATFQNNYNAVQKTEASTNYQKLSEILSSKEKTEPENLDDPAFITRVLNDFEKYLVVRSKLDPELVQVSKDFIALSSAIRGNASSVRFDQDFLTAQGGGSGPIDNAAQATTNANASVVKIQKEGDSKSKCSFGLIGNMDLPACISEGVQWIIKNTLLQIAGFLLWASANMFNYSVQIGILQFSNWAPDTLYPIWIIVRQIISLVIVFVGLYLGLIYIIGKDSSKFEHYIPWVVMFALFVNFSYPLTRTLIDVSNVVSLNIYASAVGGDALIAKMDSQDTAGALIMKRLGLQGLAISASKEGAEGENLLTSINSIPAALLAVIYTGYAAYIFFMVTAIMIMRTASLVFITIASPILLVDAVLPMIGDKAKELRKIFFEQLAVGPVFMIMLALTLKFLEVFSTTSGPLSPGGADTIKTFFNITLMLIMLHIMITVTKKISGTVGQMATNAMGTVGGFATGVAMGGTGMLARKGLGGLAVKARDSAWMSRNKEGMLGGAAHRFSNSIANSSFDLRNSTVVANQAKKIGMGLGMGSTASYQKRQDSREKEVTEGYKTAGIYSKNIYNEKGELEHAKGSVDESEEGDAARAMYVKRKTTGLYSNFSSSKQSLKDMTQTLKDADKKRGGDIMTEYKNIEGVEKRGEFLNKQTEENKQKLLESDRESAIKEAKVEDKNYKKEQERQEDRDITRRGVEAQEKAVEVAKSTSNQSGSTNQSQSNNSTPNDGHKVEQGATIATPINTGGGSRDPSSPTSAQTPTPSPTAPKSSEGNQATAPSSVPKSSPQVAAKSQEATTSLGF